MALTLAQAFQIDPALQPNDRRRSLDLQLLKKSILTKTLDVPIFIIEELKKG
jgi:hypothetical protein